MIQGTEEQSRFSLRFETSTIRVLQNMETLNFTEIVKQSLEQRWNTLEREVEREKERVVTLRYKHR